MQIRAVQQHFYRFQYKFDHCFIIRQAELWDDTELKKKLSIILKTDNTRDKSELNIKMAHISSQRLSKFIIQ